MGRRRTDASGWRWSRYTKAVWEMGPTAAEGFGWNWHCLVLLLSSALSVLSSALGFSSSFSWIIPAPATSACYLPLRLCSQWLLGKVPFLPLILIQWSEVNTPHSLKMWARTGASTASKDSLTPQLPITLTFPSQSDMLQNHQDILNTFI